MEARPPQSKSVKYPKMAPRSVQIKWAAANSITPKERPLVRGEEGWQYCFSRALERTGYDTFRTRATFYQIQSSPNDFEQPFAFPVDSTRRRWQCQAPQRSTNSPWWSPWSNTSSNVDSFYCVVPKWMRTGVVSSVRSFHIDFTLTSHCTEE